MNKKRLPIIITLLLLFIFIISYFLVQIIQNGNDNKIAYIYQNGELLKIIDLSHQNTFTITTKDGSYNTIQIDENGKIGILEASCPDKTCVHTGFTNTPSKPIICLPNKLEIKIVLEDNYHETDFDTYSY